MNHGPTSLWILMPILVLIGIFWSQYSPNQYAEVMIDQQIFHVVVASTPEKAQQGLSFQPTLAVNSGMLFPNTGGGSFGFWMKDMFFPIDIVWIDNNNRVIASTDNIGPETYPTTLTSPRPAKYALEINAGLSQRYYFQPGDRVEILLP